MPRSDKIDTWDKFVAPVRGKSRMHWEDSCLLWDLGVDRDGYPIGQQHRKAFEFFFQIIIPIGLQPDHTCRRRNCLTPFHLSPCTPRENTLRGNGRAAINARKTHCKRGHELSGSNILRRKSQPAHHRACYECAKAHHRAYQKRKHAKCQTR